MKVLIVNTSDCDGGAARAAYRLHRSLLASGVESKMLVQSKTSDDFTVLEPQTRLQKILSKILSVLDALPAGLYKNRTKTLFSPSWVSFGGIVKRINELKPDIVHLHWVAGGMLRIEDVAKIEAPIVWSMHDNWAFTGGCHIMWDCERYKQSCGGCPRLGSNKDNDLSRKVWLRKQKAFSRLTRIKFVGLSSWLVHCARESSLFKDIEVFCLPNPIDIESYAPFDKGQARNLFNLPQDKKIIAFGALSATSDINKGFKELALALRKLSPDYELVVFGAGKPEKMQGFIQRTHYLGRLHDDVSLRLLYSAADIMVVPSLQENLSNAIMESLACSTPVVAFDIGGNPDLIDHQINGYLVRPYSIDDLAFGIEWVLQHKDAEALARSARLKVVKNFESSAVALKYIDLYREVLGEVG